VVWTSHIFVISYNISFTTTTYKTNVSSIQREHKNKTQSYTYKPTEHILHQYKSRKNPKEIRTSVEETHLHTTTTSRRNIKKVYTFNYNDLTFQQLMFKLRGEHIFLYITALQTTKNPLFQYVNTGQCKNTSRRIQINVKNSNTWWWLNEPKHIVRNDKCVMCPYYLLWWRNK
jgi:hypothetical protein